MRKLCLILFTLLIAANSAFAQKVISGKSAPVRLKIEPNYVRELPPDIFVELNFEDGNNNGILEANEVALLNLSITNRGKGTAQGLLVKVSPFNEDPNLMIEDGVQIPFLYADQTTQVSIPIKAGFGIGTVQHKLKITVTEHYGYDMDPAYLVLSSLEYQEPNLVFAGLEVFDVGQGTAALNEDGKVQAGEQVRVKLVLQNIGQNVAEDTRFYVTTADNNIYLANNKGNLGDIGIGEVKEFWVTISPNKRVNVDNQLPIYLNVVNKYNRGNIEGFWLPIVLNQKPPETEIVEVKADLQKLQEQVARFEYNSKRITATTGKLINIYQLPEPKISRKNAIAIVLGVEDYKYFAKAPYATNDAKLMAQYFNQVFGIEKVFTYTNDEVSGFFFENMFNPNFGELQKAVVEGETEVFVFYSGHGLPSKDGETVYILPYDGRIEALDNQGFELSKLYSNLEALNAKSVTIFIDACFSGVSRATETYSMQNLVAMKGVSIKPKIKQPWLDNPNFIVFTSSDFEETSLGFDPSETGLFTYFVCAGLLGEADENEDGKVSSGELKEYVIEEVVQTSVKIRGQQTPRFYGNEKVILGEY
jgi:hypothetical protein